MAHPDPESAARGDISERYARTLGVATSPAGHMAIVLLGTSEPPDLYPYEVVCHRTDEGWEEGSSGNGPGWRAMPSADGTAGVEVETFWGDALAGATEMSITVDGETRPVPVIDGYYFWVVWGVPDRLEFAAWPGDAASEW